MNYSRKKENGLIKMFSESGNIVAIINIMNKDDFCDYCVTT